MIGFGITLPVLPYYAERLGASEQTSREFIILQVSLLTSLYALMQLIFAPIWGQCSDRFGRKPLLLLGIGGSAMAQILFGVSSSLNMLYLARGIDGALSSAALPAARAYVTDVTTDQKRSIGMAWLGTAISLGVVAGPALGGFATRQDIHFNFRLGHFILSSFSFPYFMAAILMLLVFILISICLPESLTAENIYSSKSSFSGLIRIESQIIFLLALTSASQLGLAIFEGTFALYAQERLNFTPIETGIVFMVCGLVMAIFQVTMMTSFSGRFSISKQLAMGFCLMGMSIILLLFAHSLTIVASTVSLFALGLSFIAPNLSALISKQSKLRPGKVLGIQNAAYSFAQLSGPLLGGVLFAWKSSAPYLITGLILFGTGIILRFQTNFQKTG